MPLTHFEMALNTNNLYVNLKISDWINNLLLFSNGYSTGLIRLYFADYKYFVVCCLGCRPEHLETDDFFLIYLYKVFKKIVLTSTL